MFPAGEKWTFANAEAGLLLTLALPQRLVVLHLYSWICHAQQY
jgi:hypothetical protein